jgi:hypothetical protein
MSEVTVSRERNIARIDDLRGRFAGEQCVILCTGPSVKDIDLSLIDEHPFVMGVNGSYFLRNQFHSYFVSNTGFVRRNLADIARIATERIFVRWDAAPLFLGGQIPESRLFYYDNEAELTTDISVDITKTLPKGPTVLLNIALPAMLWFGFQEILLLGADFPTNGYERFHTGLEGAPRHLGKPLGTYEAEMEIGRFRASLWARHLREHHPDVRVINCSQRSDLDAFEKADFRAALR